MRTVRTTLLVGALVLALGLTGCTGQEDPSGGSAPPAGAAAGGSAATAVELVSAAPDAAEQAGSARISVESVSQTPQGQVRVTGEGVVDNASGTVELTITPQLPPEAQQSGQGELGPIQMRVVDGAVYLRGVPGQADGQWLRQRVPAATGGQQGLGGDPTQTLQQLRAMGQVQDAGTATVRGVETTRYTGSIDVGKLVEQPGADTEQVRQAVEQLRAAGVEQIPVEVFLDDQGRPVRTVQTVELTVQGTQLTTTTTTELYDWGVDVDVQPPPADHVVDAPAAPTGGAAGAGMEAPATS